MNIYTNLQLYIKHKHTVSVLIPMTIIMDLAMVGGEANIFVSIIFVVGRHYLVVWM